MKRIAGRLLAAWVLLAALGTAQAQVVISQVYGGGGNSGATLRSDFIELRNNGSAAVDVTGWSVQYASSSGSTWQRTALAGSIAPGGYYLIKQADGSGGSVDLPTPDATGTITLSAASGKVALTRDGTVLAGTCPLGGAVADFVGYGSANCAETAPTPTLNNTSAALRNGDGSIDTDNNSADFSLGTPNPRNSGSAPPEPPPPPLALTIAEIQGSELRSAYVDRRVVTEGIVTARRFNNGFFLQAANDDGNPATSNGIFVFTGSAPPATAAVGNRVRVIAEVGEFVPTSNPNQLSITQLLSPEVEVLETGVALPAAIALDPADLAPAAGPAALERLEGMRASVAQAVAVAPSQGSLDENDALSFSDGVFYVTLPEVARPFREPGIGVLDVVPIPAGKNPPRFDTNPERLMVRSRGQIGAAALAVDAGAEVTGLVGVLDYNSATWALLPDVATPPTASGGVQPRAVADAGPADVTVASFNLLRLFDEIDDGASDSVVLTPEALDKRLGKTSAAICDWLKAPDILGVVEVENLRVLGLLAERINATCPRAPQYVPYLFEGNDPGGIDVGFLVATREVAPGVPRVEAVEVLQLGKDATLANPDGSTSLLNDRPPLLLRAIVRSGNGAAYPLTVINNHLRSLNDIDSVEPGSNGWATGGERVRVKRGAQAAYVAGVVEQLQQTEPNAHLVLVGDFNAFEFSDGYVDVLGIVKGEEAAEDQVLTYVDSPISAPLIDGSQLIADPAERYSYSFGGNAQTLDHVLVNEALVLDAALLQVDHARINADFGTVDFGDTSKPTRTSDHDPVRLRITVPAFRSADLGMTLAATTAGVRAGETARFAASVRNAGPDAAAFAAVAFVFEAQLSPAVTAPASWSCAAPTQTATATTVTCTTPSLAAGDEAAFAIEAIAPALGDGGTLRLAASAQSQTADPANGDNGASAEVAILTAADLSVRILGSALPVRKGAIATFLVPVRNAGPDAANGTALVIEGNVAASNAAVAAPSGWSCRRIAESVNFRAECTRAALPNGTQWLAFALVVPERPLQGAALEFSAAVSAQTPDPQLDNNLDAISVQIRRR